MYEKKVRTFFSEAGYERAMNVLDIAMADRLGQYNPLQNSSDLSDVDKLKTILKKTSKRRRTIHDETTRHQRVRYYQTI